MTYTEPLLLAFFALCLWGFVKRKPLLLAAGLSGLFLSTWGPAEWLFSRPLESRYSAITLPQGDAEAIVVLAAGIEGPKKYCPIAMPDESSFARCRYGAWLYHHWRQLPVLTSGGVNATGTEPFAATLAELLVDYGVPAGQVWIETSSRNTYENAKFCAEILRRKGIGRIALVVEADTMLRAESCFRKQGIVVIPAPFNHRAMGSHLQDYIPGWTSLERNERALHEYGGLLWYKMRGWI